MMVTAAHWVHWFNHRRLYQYGADIPPDQYGADIPPVELEAAYYAHHRRPAAG